jgi:YidC/Oxa1 family membrane protein insertase
VILNKFQQANDMGRPVWLDDAKRTPAALELVPAVANQRTASNLTLHYDVNDSGSESRPLDTLGRQDWILVGDKDHPVTESSEEGRAVQRVSFQAEVQNVVITKTYSLTEGQYHLGLEMKLRLKDGVEKAEKFRYQLTGAHGLPVEGKWYTSVFRNAMIAQEEGQSIWRDLQDLRQISHKEGGDEVRRNERRRIRYAGVAVQYFASVIVVDDEQKDQDFISRARPTLEVSVTKGTIKSIAPDLSTFVLAPQGQPERTFFVHQRDRGDIMGLLPGSSLAVVHYSASFEDKLKASPDVVLRVDGDPAAIHSVWEDDITVRLMTEPAELKPGKEVVHKYMLYNGPLKVSLLGQMTGAAQVSPDLVNRYVESLHLNTLTDYQSPGWLGSFASSIYWTNLVIKCTNLMHWVLGHIHYWIASYGLCIMLLTVMVRGLMFPVSRKQAMTTMKMQEMAPELKKLQEKFKDDRQAMGMAQMELYRKHGVNPLGTCWFLLLQMPIFMGLYFALQESIHFRLAEFWPTWILNLAAPDMMISWGERIPWISRPEDYGGFFYLGPFFNLLPVIAVSLMIAQQKMMTPPPANEEQAMQQKIMKYMMIFFGLMFYKVAAGLCIYFIASSIWGFAERRLLPKKKPEVGEVSADGFLQRMVNRARATDSSPSSTQVTTPTVTASAVSASEPAGRNRNRPGRNKRRQERAGRNEPAGDDAASGGILGWLRDRRARLREWWSEVLRQAQKK